MPLTNKGKKIKKAMKAFYKKKTGSSKKGEEVFYASQNKGTITGTHKKTVRNSPKMKVYGPYIKPLT
jgi:hypothetical protein